MRSQTKGLPVDEDKSETVKRPMNSFMVFSSERRPILLQTYPDIDNKLASKILGNEWKALTLEEKESYHDKALAAKKEHMRLHPDYKYSPHEARKRKKMKQINKYEAFSKAGGKRRKNEFGDTDPEADELMYGRSNSTEQGVFYFENDQGDEMYRFPDDPVLFQYRTTPHTMEGVPYFHGRLPEHPAVCSTSVNSTQSLNFPQQPIFCSQIPHEDTFFNCPNCGYRFVESSLKCQQRHESSEQPKTFAHYPSKYYKPPSFQTFDGTCVPCYTNSGFACYPQFNRPSHETGNEFAVKNHQENVSMPFQGWNDGYLPTFNPLQSDTEMPNPEFESQTFFNSASDGTSTHFHGQHECIPSYDFETADESSAAQNLINDSNTIENENSSPILSVGSESEFENPTSSATNELHEPVHEDEIIQYNVDQDPNAMELFLGHIQSQHQN